MVVSITRLILTVFILATPTMAASPSKPPLVVMMGGWFSCDSKPEQPMPPPHSMLWSDHADCFMYDAWPKTPPTDSEPEKIYSCFTGDTNIDKAQFRYGANGEVPSSLGTGNPVGVMEKFAEYVKKKANGREILFVGHSHGGWGAMQTALRFPPEQASFVALDPVSRVNCPPSTFLDSAKTLVERTVKIPADCGGFPSDFDHAQLKQLFAAKRKVAVSIYAGRSDGGLMIPPHSGMLAMKDAADRAASVRVPEPKVNASDVRDSKRALTNYDYTRALGHQAVSRDTRTWDEVRKRVSEGYGVTLGGCDRYKDEKPPLFALPKVPLPRPSTVAKVAVAVASAHNTMVGNGARALREKLPSITLPRPSLPKMFGGKPKP